MTHRDAVFAALKDRGPLSDYAIYHHVRSLGIKASPSSVRTRRSELQDAGVVRPSGRTEPTPSGARASLWELVA